MGYLLALIIVVGIITRTIGLTNLPSGFTPDEAAFGYNSYSLLMTGKDEWGIPFWQLPFSNLRSFGDYKLPLYSFLAIPLIKFLGLNEFSTRLSSGIIGILTIIGVHLLTRKLSASKGIAQLSAMFMVISPWSISLSRGAFEANLVPFFNTIGLALILTKKQILSAIFFALTFYSYHSGRFLAPVIIAISYIFFKTKFQLRFFIVFIILIVPGLISLMGNSYRVGDVSIFSPTDKWENTSSRRFASVNLGLPDPVARIFSNKITTTFSTFINNYISYFSPEFLFTKGVKEATYGMIPGRGVLYYLDILLLVYFFCFLIRKPEKKHFWLLLMILISALPASLTKGPGGAANRAVPMLPFFVIALSFGYQFLREQIKFPPPRLSAFLLAFYVSSFIFFFQDYIYHSPSATSYSMAYGWKELIFRVSPWLDKYQEIRVDRGLSEPHIFFAFYLQINPNIYQDYSSNWPDFISQGFSFLDQYDGYYLKNLRFGDLHLDQIENHPTLFISRPENKPDMIPEIFSLNNPSNRPYFTVFEYRQQ